MTNILKQYFPMIRTREEIVEQIKASRDLRILFEDWSEKGKEEFLDFCSGARGIKMTYDSFFKEIFNPETVPERLNDFLSQILRMRVRIVQVLPNDTVRIGEETSLIVTDIIVEDEYGRIFNIEIQKIGYLFPGERTACYAADMLLRQYKRARSKKQNKFSYRDIKGVYILVLFEKSPKEFHEFPETYIHEFKPVSSTGLSLNLLQNYWFIPLDIFRKNLYNKGIQDERDAWLTFLCVDDPEMIAQLIERFPKFKAMYEHIYDMCQNIEEVMQMYSKELLEMDRNTVKIMIDEMQEELECKAKELESTTKELESRTKELESKDKELENKDEELEVLRQKIMKLEQDLKSR